MPRLVQIVKLAEVASVWPACFTVRVLVVLFKLPLLIFAATPMTMSRVPPTPTSPPAGTVSARSEPVTVAAVTVTPSMVTLVPNVKSVRSIFEGKTTVIVSAEVTEVVDTTAMVTPVSVPGVESLKVTVKPPVRAWTLEAPRIPRPNMVSKTPVTTIRAATPEVWGAMTEVPGKLGELSGSPPISDPKKVVLVSSGATIPG